MKLVCALGFLLYSMDVVNSFSFFRGQPERRELQSDGFFLNISAYTAGTACTNQNDQDSWDLETSFAFFGKDMETCTRHYTEDALTGTMITAVQSCMSFGQPIDSSPGWREGILGPNYSEGCAFCMGKLAQCTYDECRTECAVTGEDFNICRECPLTNPTQIDSCVSRMYECSGIDTSRDQYYVAPDDDEGIPWLIVIPGLFGGIFAIGFVGFFFWYVGWKNNRGLTESEKAMLAQSFAIPDSKPISELPGAAGDSFGSAPAGGAMTMAPPPGIGMSNETGISQVNIAAGPAATAGVSLIARWSFKATKEDELTVDAGEILTGVEEVDNWWFAKKSDGTLGLIPGNYVSVDELTRRPSF